MDILVLMMLALFLLIIVIAIVIYVIVRKNFVSRKFDKNLEKTFDNDLEDDLDDDMVEDISMPMPANIFEYSKEEKGINSQNQNIDTNNLIEEKNTNVSSVSDMETLSEKTENISIKNDEVTESLKEENVVIDNKELVKEDNISRIDNNVNKVVDLINVLINKKNYIFLANGNVVSKNDHIKLMLDGKVYFGVITKANYQREIGHFKIKPRKLIIIKLIPKVEKKEDLSLKNEFLEFEPMKKVKD